MQEIGQILRDSRKAQHYTLEQVNQSIRINPRYLEAMEAGNFSALPSSAHARGFLRNYARFLGLDTDELLLHYEAGGLANELPSAEKRKKVSKKQPIPPRKENPFYRSQGLEIHTPQKAGPSGDKLLRWVISLAILGAIGIVGYGLFMDNEPFAISDIIPSLQEEPSSANDVNSAQVAEVIEDEAVDDLTAEDEDGNVIIETKNNILPPLNEAEAIEALSLVVLDKEKLSLEALGVDTDSILLQVEVLSDRSILIVTADGEEVFRNQVTKEKYPSPILFDAKQELTLQSGNAGAIRLTINDKLVGLLGESKETFEYTWVTSGDGIIDPEPEIETSEDEIIDPTDEEIDPETETETEDDEEIEDGAAAEDTSEEENE